ncbi:MAG TPA: hypothetical protein VGR16_13910 [Thermomicrobiales bacterium]|nr:hypothetical protein [Thermomicrobiales bacterium]
MRPTGQLIAGFLLSLLGIIWVLQGFNRFPGRSFATGQWEWVIIGVIVALAGTALVYLGRRPPRT